MNKLMEYLQLAYAEAEYSEMAEVAILILLAIQLANNKSGEEDK